jgi:hypothetical protein
VIAVSDDRTALVAGNHDGSLVPASTLAGFDRLTGRAAAPEFTGLLHGGRVDGGLPAVRRRRCGGR